MSEPIRNRIVRHERVRASDLLPHELNPRAHPQAQRDALAALLREVGFARSLLAYEVQHEGRPRLKLIDGHLRRALDPALVVDVEVLDVSEDEARKLLLSLDPLAGLAHHDDALLDRLRGLVHSPSDALTNLWRSLGEARAATDEALTRARRPRAQAVPEQYLVLVECRDEAEQTALLARFQADGLRCRALVS